MRRLAQFVRLHLSRVCVHLSRVRLASVCVCSRQGFRMRASARVYLLASICSRLSASVCVCLHLSARVCLTSVVLSCVCLHLSRVRLASVCVCSRQGFRMLASASVSRLASVCVGRLVSRLSVLVNACGNWLILCRSSFKEFKRFLLSSYYRCTYRLCRLYEQTFNILI